MSEFGQVNAQRLGIGAQSLFLNRLQSAGCNAQLDPTIAFCPPKTTLLQIGLLQLLRTDVGMAHGHAVIGASTCELTHPRHVFVLLIELVGSVQTGPTPILPKGALLKASLHQGSHKLSASGLKASQFVGFESANAKTRHVVEVTGEVLRKAEGWRATAIAHQHTA